MTKKICNHCKMPIELTDEYYHHHEESPDGFYSVCKLCRNAYARAKYIKRKRNPNPKPQKKAKKLPGWIEEYNIMMKAKQAIK